jgi:cell wall-associated NlpC family hydrolase
VTPKGLDCSGLVQTVFRLHGVLLPRDSGDQFLEIRRSTYIYRDPAETQPGHLLFFGKTDRAITHVGIGIGGGRMLHAQGRVRIDTLSPGDPEVRTDLLALFRGAGPVLIR